jgi:hypothetical protein
MNEPTRWRDGVEGLDPEIARLLHSTPVSRPMTARQYARTWRRLQPLVALAPGAGILLWVKASLGALAVVAVGTATVYAVQQVSSPRERPQPPVAQLAPAPPPVEPELADGSFEPVSSRSVGRHYEAPAPGTGALPTDRIESDAFVSSAVEPKPPIEAAPAAKPPSNKVALAKPIPTAAGDSLEQELALIEHARALVESNPAEAHRLLRDHAARFPRGTLAMEREMVMIEALMHSGRRTEARNKAESMLKNAKGSLYETRLSNLLQQMQ